MKVYYAHCKAIYNTPQEQRDIETLTKLGFEVVNPNDPKIGEELAKFQFEYDRMEYFRKFALDCDAIAFRALPGGAIPGGVAKELGYFKEEHKPAIELPHFALRQVLDKDETRLYLHEVGQR